MVLLPPSARDLIAALLPAQRISRQPTTQRKDRARRQEFSRAKQNRRSERRQQLKRFHKLQAKRNPTYRKRG